MPKVYFLDPGLANLIIKQFGELNVRPDRGAIVENYVFIHLYRELPVLDELYFWRTKNGVEVDFVLSTMAFSALEKQLIPVEVKYQVMRKAAIPSGLRSFLNVYPVEQAAVITKDYYGQLKHNKTKIHFLPAWLLGTIK